MVIPLLLRGAALALGLAVAGIASAAPDDIAAVARSLGRGINLGNALEAPAEGAWGVTLRADYFKTIRDAGFATVRLPVRWSAHARSEPPFTIDPAFAARVDWAIDQALANHLNVIVNVHHYEEMDTDPDTHLPRLAALWEQIAARHKDRPAEVLFELLNEPHGKLTGARWNAAIPTLLAAARKGNPSRPVLVGPSSWNSIGGLATLELPKEDRNLIVTVHYYEPFTFTHQGASWVKGAERWPARAWSGTDGERKPLRAALGRAAEWAKARGRPLYLGEFGAYEKADMESRVRWTRFVAREAERLGMSWAYWEFCAGFGAYDPKAGAWRDPLKSALIE
ncbi:MAG: glycoside hydrolase family 5 protein [Planctomycetes bacterium]|nr:glycoside hydrolase family 5 protein [Planctomycetota bacterium]